MPRATSSFETLYARHAEDVYLWALRYAKGRPAWAEDVAHEVFVQALKHAEALRPEEVKGWLYRVTQNQAYRQLRRDRFLDAALSALGGLFSGSRDRDTPDEKLQRKVDARSATAAVDRLPPQQRVVIIAKVLDGKSQREIAQLLSLSEGQVSKLLARAFARLQADGWEPPGDG